MRSKVPICVVLLLVLAWPALSQTPEPIEHRLEVTLEPDRSVLRVTDQVALGDLESGDPIEFLLNSALVLQQSEPAVEKMPLGDVEGFYGINGTSIELSDDVELTRYRVVEPLPNGILTLSYAGDFDFGLSDQAEEYTRGFRETAGIVGEEGVYLAGSGFWYPSFGDQLLEFDMEVDIPVDWQVISQGNGTAQDGEGKARWSSGGAMDEIYLVGGPLVAYEEAAGAVTAQVFLNKHTQDAVGFIFKYKQGIVFFHITFFGNFLIADSR